MHLEFPEGMKIKVLINYKRHWSTINIKLTYSFSWCIINSLLVFLAKNHFFLLARKMKFSIKDFFSKCDQIRSFLRIWSHLLKKSLMENFILCAMSISSMIPLSMISCGNHFFYCSIFSSLCTDLGRPEPLVLSNVINLINLFQ